MALACGAARAEGGVSALDLLRFASVAPTADGLELTLRLEQDEVGELGRAALDTYLRANQPRLFSRLSLGVVRYLHPRLVAREVRVTPRKKRDNVLDIEVAAELVADAEKREVDCDMDGWTPSCETRWVDRGEAAIARLSASGQLSLSLRPGATLAGRPVLADVLIDRVRGALEIGGLADLDLAVDLDPPYRARRIELGLPASAKKARKRFGGMALRRFRVAAAPENRVAITAVVGVAPTTGQ